MDKENIEFMKNKLLSLISYFSDVQNYYHSLMHIDDEYDETLENYNFDEWLEGAGGKRTQMAAALLSKTVSIFNELTSESILELYAVYEEICTFDEKEQVKVWGRKRKVIEKEQFDEELSEEFEWKDCKDDLMKEFIRVLDNMEE